MIRRFAFEWLFFAPVAMLIAILVGLLFGADIFGPQLRTGALVTYGLSFFLAFYDELPLSQWDTQGWVWATLSSLMRLVYWALIVLALFGITAVLIVTALGTALPDPLGLFMTAFGVGAAGIGFLVGIGGLATQIKERST